MTENTMDEIIKRQEKERQDFQDACEHKEISDWMDYMWAPGHMGLPVKVCRRCNKIMETKKWEHMEPQALDTPFEKLGKEQHDL